jgi:hypothetical protein
MNLRQYIPWLGSIFLEAILIVVMFRKRIHKRFPVFSSYVIYDLVRAIAVPLIALIAFRHRNTYFYSYWISISIEYTITLFIILEVFAYIFSAHIRYSPRFLQTFTVLAFLLFVLSVILVILPDIPTNTMTRLILTLDRSVQLLICGLLFFMWSFSKNLGIQWQRHHVWGIVFGLATYSSVNLVVAAIKATTGEMCPGWITPLPHFAYLATIAFWIGYLVRKEPEREPLTNEELTAYQNLITAYRGIIADIRKVIR